MTLSVQIGLLLALACAFVGLLGFLFKQRGAVAAPPVRWRRPFASTAALFANRWWTIGILVAIGGWFLHVAALALAPISLVQSVIAGGLVLLTVIADRLFGFRVTRREWIGVALTAAGLAFLAATLGDTGDSAHSDYATVTLALYVGGLTALALVLCVVPAADDARRGVVIAAAAGLLWGASDVAIKAGSGSIASDGLLVLFTPLAAVITVVSLVGLLVSARSLQLGEAVAVIAVTSAAGNVVTIASGPIVFGEPMPQDTLGVAVRLLAFALVIVAAALTPGPLRPSGAPAADVPAGSRAAPAEAR